MASLARGIWSGGVRLSCPQLHTALHPRPSRRDCLCRQEVARRALIIQPRCDHRDAEVLPRRDARSGEPGSSACRRKRPRPAIAEWFHRAYPRHPQKHAWRHRRQRRVARRDRESSGDEAGSWARLSIVGQGHVTSFTTIRAVVESIGTKADILLALADGAVLFAIAVLFGFIALCTKNLLMCWHAGLREKLYLSERSPARAGWRGLHKPARGGGGARPVVLTAYSLRANMHFCPSKRNGIRNLSSQFSSS
jgi:hypothetical protein